MKFNFKGKEVKVTGKRQQGKLTVKNVDGSKFADGSDEIEALPGDVGFVPDDFFPDVKEDK